MSAKVLDFGLTPRVNAPGVDKDLKSLNKAVEAAKQKEEKEQQAMDAIVSKFEKTLKRHKKSLKKKNQTLTDSAGNVAILEAMLQMTLSMIPVAEKMYQRYKNERAAYAVVALVNQGRELSADIQRLGGAASAAPVIINTIVMPNFQHMLQNTLNEGALAIKSLKNVVPKNAQKQSEEIIKTMIKNQSSFLSQINLAISDKIEKYFDEK